MEQQTQSINPTLADVMPKYLRERFAKRAQQSTQTATDEKQPENSVENDIEQTDVETPTTEVETAQMQTDNPTDTPSESKEANDAKAWQGRLTKEQEKHRETNNRLLAEAQARQEAEAQAKAEAEKRQALEQRLKDFEQGNAESTKATTPPPNVETLSDTEIEEIGLLLGEPGKKLVRYLRQTQAATPPTDVGQMVDERLAQAQAKQTAEQQSAAFAKAVSEQVPEMQGLLLDPAFGQFLQDKVIDWAGNTAASFVYQIGQSKDIDRLPKLRELIDEYQQSKQPPKETITTPPSSKGAAVKNPKAKPKMTAKDIAYKNKLARTPGKTEELRQFLAKFDHS